MNATEQYRELLDLREKYAAAQARIAELEAAQGGKESKARARAPDPLTDAKKVDSYLPPR